MIDLCYYYYHYYKMFFWLFLNFNFAVKVSEVGDYWSLNSGPTRWHLTAKDIKGILHLRF